MLRRLINTKVARGQLTRERPVVETVGNTPLVKLNRVAAGLSATILLKCEFFNPLGSVKDRIGVAMVEDAERRGRLNKDSP